MTIKTGVPLEQTGLIGEDTDIARALSITTLEELLSLYLTLPDDTVKLFGRTDWGRVVEQAPTMVQYAVTEAEADDVRRKMEIRGTGAMPPTQADAEREAALYTQDLDLVPGEPSDAAEVFLGSCFDAIRNQGSRGTCVAHAVAAVEECLEPMQLEKHVDLSEQFLYWSCKLNDGFPEDSGTWQRVAVPLVVSSGICLEATWPYNPNPIPDNEGQGPPPSGWDAVFNDAEDHKPVHGIVLDRNSVDGIINVLKSDRPVSVSVPVFPNWRGPAVEREGHIPMPPPGRLPIGGHAMCVVGFGYDSAFLGGGYFVVRNSWGDDWAFRSPFGAGYGTLPFSYIRRYCWEAYTLTRTP